MSGIVFHLSNLIDAINDLPSYPFRADVKKAEDYLAKFGIPSDDVAALYLRTIIRGARSLTAFTYKADLDAAEAALKVYRPTLAA